MIIKYYSSKRNKEKRISLLFVVYLIFLQPIMFYFIGRLEVSKPSENIVKNIVIKECLHDDDYLEFTEENLLFYINKFNIRFPELVFTQAYHETGGFKSELFINQNNLFGMKVPKVRAFVSECSNCEMSSYKNMKLAGWQVSLLDYALWQNKYNKFKNEEKYLEYLDKVYAEDPKYVQKLKILKKQLWQ